MFVAKLEHLNIHTSLKVTSFEHVKVGCYINGYFSRQTHIVDLYQTKDGRKIPPIPPSVFTGGIYRYFPAWQIRLKWQILANNGNITFLPRNTGKYDF